MLSMNTTIDEKRKFLNELEASNISEESLDVEDEYIDDDYMNLAPKHICTMCGSDFTSLIALVKHKVDVHIKQDAEDL